MPSPTIRVGFSRCSSATASTLSAGTRSASTSSRSSAAPIVSAASARSPVTMTMRATPATAKSADGPRRLATQFVCKQQGTNGAPVDRDEHTEGGAPGRAPQRPRRPLLQPASAIDELMRTDANLPPSTTPPSPDPMVSRTFSGISS